MPAQNTAKKLLAFSWYGGKFSHLKFLLPILDAIPHQHYCEPFGGSAAVLLNKPPANIETYNDLDSEVVNFFRVLRDLELRDSLIWAIRFTPYSREEFRRALEPADDPQERARRFFVRARQVRAGLAATHMANVSAWQYDRNRCRYQMSSAISKMLNAIEHLSDIAVRFLTVQIENDTALKVIERYDSEGTLFYLDPPYPHESRGKHSNGYAHEMNDQDHEQLAEKLHGIQGKAVISGYRCELMDRLYATWQRIDAKLKPSPASGRAGRKQTLRQECVWLNVRVNTNEISGSVRHGSLPAAG